MMIKHFDLVLCAILTLSILSCTNKNIVDMPKQIDAPHVLRFNEDGKFKIVVFSDIHSDFDNIPESMGAILDVEKPDLVILGGDNVSWLLMDETENSVQSLVSPMVERGIKWCHVFGNHDREYSLPGYLQKIYLSQEKCVSSDVEELDGIGTYCLQIFASGSDETAFVIWCMDSHDYASELNSYYDCVHLDQIEWYKQKSEEIEKTAGKKIYGMMYMHIPMQQLQYIADNPEQCEIEGSQNEPVCCSDLDYGLFEALKERQDVKLVLNGHDHSNHYTGVVDGIKFGYCGTISMTMLQKTDENRGTRVIVIDENDPSNPQTYMAFSNDPKYCGDK